MTETISLLDGIASTRAIRRYADAPVETADLNRILFAATRAPSGSNRQPYRFLVLRDGPQARQAKALLGTTFRDLWGAKRDQDGYDAGSGARVDSPKARMARTMEIFVDRFERTPVVVLACLVHWRGGDPTEGASIYPACQNLLLAARALGYGGVMTVWHKLVEGDLKAILGIPEGVSVAAVIPLGVPIGGHGPVRRRPLHASVFEDRWDEPAPWAHDPPGTRHTSWRRGEP
jgi:nitroreductase